jgi:hypothetical protein
VWVEKEKGTLERNITRIQLSPLRLNRGQWRRSPYNPVASFNYEALVCKLHAVLVLHIVALRAEPIDYELLMEQLSEVGQRMVVRATRSKLSSLDPKIIIAILTEFY